MQKQSIAEKIIDTHIHIWDLEKVRYSWLDGDTSILNRTYLLDELLPSFHRAGISAGILVQAANNLDDTALMLQTAAAHQEIQGVVGWLPLTNPEQTATLLETRFLKEPYFKGVRHLIHNEPDARWLLQPAVLESLNILASYNIPYDVVGINNEHLKTAIKVTEKVPSLAMVLDHLNQPPIATRQQFGDWGILMKEIAASPNVYAKISGQGTASGNFANWSAADIEPYIEYVLNVFGSNRCFGGGDWPVATLAGSYEKLWNIYRSILQKLLPEDGERARVLYHNAKAFYGIAG
ncbi:MAG: amidohydrolase family protein [Agriterribacter sp.]